MNFTIDIPSWDAGFEAGMAGASLESCPYRPASQESLSWHSGFIEGKAARQKHPK